MTFASENEKRIMYFLKHIQLSLILLLSSGLFAQTGTLAGIVKDAENGSEIIAASIYVKSTGGGAYTNYEGKYVIENLPVGVHEVEFRYLAYVSQTITVTIKANQTTELNVDLKPEGKMLGAAVVKAERITNTEQAVVLEVRKAQQVVSGISKEQMAKSQDNNAAQVISRVPGVTVVENRFVMIRGLSERYNNTMINNVIAPSTEVDRRTFSFDLIGSSALDRMLIFKSGSADLPGDFSGGIVKLFTVEAVSSDYTHVKVGYGHRAGTTFAPYFQSQGSSTDWLGFDNGFRALPSTFPTTDQYQSLRRDSEIRQTHAHTLPNNFVVNQSTAIPDMSIGFDFGRNFNIKKIKVTAINSINYSVSQQYFAREFNRYFDWADKDLPIEKRFSYVDENYQRDVKVNILSNWVFTLSDRSKLKFKNLFNQIGENETIIRNGFDFIQRPNDNLQNYLLGYKSRSIYMGQLEWNFIPKDNHVLTTVVGFNYIGESEPDLRRFRTFRPKSSPSEAGYQMQLPPSSNLFETGRYYGNMSERSGSHGLDYTIKLDEKKESRKISVGYFTDFKSRSFGSRYFSYLYPGFNDPMEGERLRRLPLSEIFSNENIKTRDGFILEEGTRPIDAYTALNILGAGYANYVLPINRSTYTFGFRAEFNYQQLLSENEFEKIRVVNPIFTPLPFINYSYNINKSSLLRMGYSRTVNRPEFRELAPFLFYDYKMEAGRIGNPNLKTATIDNLDVRYEAYPRNGETVSIGAFYKRFTNPIENRTIITTEQPTFTYINADFAQNMGIELELRKSLEGLTSNKFINNLSVNLNASLISSRVDLGSSAVAQDRVRPLQGQSPYILNAALSYNNDPKKLSVTATYNIFGDRIYSVGDVLFPTIYELSRHSLDLTLNKKVGDRFVLKMGIQDVLNFKYRFYEDSDRNEKINERDNPIVVYRRGSYFSISASYNIHKDKK